MISIKCFESMSLKERSLFLEGIDKTNISGCKRSLVYGIGVNDAKYCTRKALDGKQVSDPAYDSWASMLMRAYSKRFHSKRPSYVGVAVCDEWHSFMKFREWWLEHQVDGWHLDKDLVGNGMVYSPDACIFVPPWLNTFVIDSGASRGNWPIGVCFHSGVGRLRAQCRNPETKKKEHLGYFDSVDDASKAWKGRKIELVNIMKAETDKIDKRIHDGLLRIIKEAV